MTTTPSTRRWLLPACTLLGAVLAPALASADEPAATTTIPPPAAAAPAAPAAPVCPTSTTTLTSAEPLPPVEPVESVEADRTLLRNGIHHGGYGAPESKITSLTGDVALLVGVQAGWIIDKHLVIGGAGYGLVSNHTPVEELQSATGSSRIELGYGGPRVAWIVAPTEIVHLTLGTLIGAGGLDIATKDPGRASGYNHHDSAAFFALEPQAEMEVNVARYVRVAVGGSYRYLGDTGKPGLHASDLSGPAASLAVKIGYF